MGIVPGREYLTKLKKIIIPQFTELPNRKILHLNMSNGVTDQAGRQVFLPAFPQKIISTVPSQTELLFDLGLDAEVIGITKFCVHPARWKSSKANIGGTKKLNIEKIKSLQPDLIIANKEENTKEQIDELSENIPVWVSDVKNLDDALSMIHYIGEITGRKENALKIIGEITSAFEILPKADSKKSVLYLIWRKPWMTVGADTFIHDMISRCGLQNACDKKFRYPELTGEEISRLNPGYIFLSSEPYPFAEKHIAELKSLCPSSGIFLVNGEYFSWYGSRLVHAASYFKILLAEIFSDKSENSQKSLTQRYRGTE